MSIFTPLSGFIGGSLIGTAASVLLITNGDILGISGILSTTFEKPLVSIKLVSTHWKLVFIGSFALTSFIYATFIDVSSQIEQSYILPSTFANIIGGFLVGLGTKLGNGCTSGHGVCGLPRGSIRSFTATITFFLTGLATATILSPYAAWAESTEIFRTFSTNTFSGVSKPLSSLIFSVLTMLPIIRYIDVNDTSTLDFIKHNERKVLGAAASGSIMALGLAISGMTQARKVIGFLDLTPLFTGNSANYDPTLVTVLGSAVGISWLGYQYVKDHSLGLVCDAKNALSKPLCVANWSIPTSTIIDQKLILGALLFGLGWGIAGICPGPALFQTTAGIINVTLGWMPAFFIGSRLGVKVKDYFDKPAPNNQEVNTEASKLLKK